MESIQIASKFAVRVSANRPKAAIRSSRATITANDPKRTFAKDAMIDVDRLSEALQESGLVNGPAAANVLPSKVWKLKSDGPVNAAHIHRLYSRRSQHLPSKQSEHANQLKYSVDELLREIESRSVKEIMSLEFPAARLGSYIVWLDAESNDPIGCFHTVSQLEVSAAKWRKLWGEP